ncbi:MAG: hypothetical protein K6U02_05480 [Firmicutes bacterium]|nr:hypothetical protein [Bacillota bacterium]
MKTQKETAERIRVAQLRRLHLLWREWAGRLRLGAAGDRALRHYYVELFSGQRASETTALTRADADRVIQWLERLVRARHERTDWAAGTAGRRGYPEWRRLAPTPAAWRALWGTARALGMSRQRLDAFIARRYAARGLRSAADLHTMADVNRVLWGLKAILRRRERRAAA